MGRFSASGTRVEISKLVLLQTFCTKVSVEISQHEVQAW